MIALERVSFAYQPGAPALRDCTLRIDTGLTLVLGPNGAGKSTLMRVLAGVERPDAGHVTIEGRDLWREEVASRRALAYVPDHPDLTPYATVREILTMVSRVRGAPAASVEDLLREVALHAEGDRTVRELSAGQRRRAIIAAAWIGRPRVVVLDEPLDALDRTMRARLSEWIDARLADGAAVVVATHDVEPFVSRAVGAIAMRESRARPVALSSDPAARTAAIDALARGLGA